MIRAGDTIENPVTGERIVFRQTSAETNGEAVVIECFVEPSGFVAKAHVHPSQSERFEILSGSVTFKLDGQELPAAPATSSSSRPAGSTSSGTRATRRRTSGARFARRWTFEPLIETMFSLAAAGKTNRKGMPNPLRLAVIAHAHFDTVRLPFPPAWMQRLGLILGAPLGRLVGYRPTYAQDVERLETEVAPA